LGQTQSLEASRDLLERDRQRFITVDFEEHGNYTTQKLKFGFSRQMIAESKPVKTDKPYRDMVRKSWLVLAGEGSRGKGEF